jgi:hypothetical protein
MTVLFECALGLLVLRWYDDDILNSQFGGKPLCTCWASNIHCKVLLVNITGNPWVLLAVPVLVKTCTGGCKYEFA